MAVPEAKTDQGSAGPVPGAEDQTASTPDGKKVISLAAATALRGATGGVLPDHYVVKDEPKPKPEPAPKPEAPKDQDPDPDPEGNPDFDVEPEEKGIEGETGTSSEPEKDPFPASTPEGEPTPAEDGYTYQTLGALEVRTDKDGNVQVKENINGQIAWINDDAYKAGYQLKQHTDRQLQQFAEERKAFEKKKEFDSILSSISGPKKQTEEGDDLWGADPEGSTSSDKVSRLEKEVDSLKAERTADKKAETEAAQRNEFDRKANLARAEMDEYCDIQGVKPPNDDQLITMCQEYAENTKIPIMNVAISPVDLIKMVKGKLSKKKKAVKQPSADSTKIPPTGAPPRKGTPMPSKQLAEVDKKLADLREKSAKFGGNNPKIAAELISLNREKKQLLKGK